MTLKRLASLQLILLGGLGSVFLIPKDIKMQPAAISFSLPQMVADWQGDDAPVSEGEREILGPDTQFARKVYRKGTDEVIVSIVLSGPDMNTSIHRPERCLPAQGWTILNSEKVSLPMAAKAMNVTRLRNVRSVPLQNGQPFAIKNLSYYWFVGHSDMTPSHYERTWIDIRDRVLRGQNQQWAYVTVSATVTQDFRVFGHDEKQTDEILRDFIRNFVSEMEKLSVPSSS